VIGEHLNKVVHFSTKKSDIIWQ